MAKYGNRWNYIPKNNPFYQDIWRDLKQGLDVVIIIVGRKRTGKSIRSVKLAETIDSKYDIGTYPAGPTNQNFFSIQEFLTALDERGEQLDGHAVTLQELGVAVYRRNFQKEANKLFNMVMQMIGMRRLCFIWTLPTLSFLDTNALALANYLIEIKSLNKNTNMARCEVSKIQHNPKLGKTYIRTYRFQERNKARSSFMNALYLGLPSRKNRLAYDEQDRRFKNQYFHQSKEKFIAAEKKEEKINAKKMIE